MLHTYRARNKSNNRKFSALDPTMNSIYSPIQLYSLDQIEMATSISDGMVTAHFKDLILSSHFQPIFSLAHKRPVGYEALLRARTATGASISPLEVFAMVQSEAETVFLDRLCRNMHVRNFATMADDTSWLFLNINPMVTIKGKHYGAFFADMLERYGIPAYRIVIEILEGSIQDESLLADAVTYYKDMGCLIAIDDFGTGHSNFDRIWHLSPQIVKLDRSMIARAATNFTVRRVLPNLVSMIHESASLSLIEGVETEEEALIAMDCGIDFVQGYYFGRPEKSIQSGNPASLILPQLCDKFKHYTLQESQKYRNKLQPYISAFLHSAKHIAKGKTAETACLDFLSHPKITRCYLLNQEGMQLESTMTSALHHSSCVPRFRPLQDARDANWSRRHYFQRAINNHEEVQVSRPYLSITDANMCVTLSVSITSGLETQVLCCDLNWEHDGG